jgi:DNA-binding IclR family transcriptional regulator
MNNSEVPINSVKRSYEIINTISERERAGVTELSASLELPKSTIHNHLQTLETLGYLVKTGGKYRLSNQYLRLGRESRNSNDLFIHGRKAVKELADQANTYNQLVIEENGRGTILLATGWQYESLPPSAQHIYPTHEYLHTNAPGKAILASLPEERVAEIIETHGLVGRTNRTITDEEELLDQLSTIRERGYATDSGEMINGIVGTAASIASKDAVYGAIGAYGPASKLQSAIENDLPKRVYEKAREVREDLVFATSE